MINVMINVTSWTWYTHLHITHIFIHVSVYLCADPFLKNLSFLERIIGIPIHSEKVARITTHRKKIPALANNPS